MLRKYFWAFVILALFLGTLAMLPRVDHVEPNAFFYFQRLPLLYNISIVASIAIAILVKDRITQLVSICVFALLIMWTPFIMLVQPWHLDSYPFFAQGTYVQRNGHIGDFALLAETPGLGLTFGSYLLVTSFPPIELMKLYPCFLTLILVILIYIISYALKIDKKASIVAGLLAIAFFWPNEMHVTRQGLAIIPYLISMLLFVRLLTGRMNLKLLFLMYLQIVFLILTHPATPLILIYNLIAIGVLGWVSGKFGVKELRLVRHVATVSIVLWLLWNMIGAVTVEAKDIIYAIGSMGARVVESIQENPTEMSGIARIFVGYTGNYRLILNARFLLSSFIFLASFLVPLFVIVRLRRHLEDWRPLAVMIGWSWSNMAIALPLLYIGLPYFARPALFSFISWAPVGALAYNMITNWGKKVTITRRKFEIPLRLGSAAKLVFLMVFVVGPALILPVVKYSPLPYLAPTSLELASKKFWDFHWSGWGLLYLDYYHPIYYSYILYGVGEPLPTREWAQMESLYRPGEGLNLTATRTLSIWMTYRLHTRDAFYAYDPSMLQVIENVTSTLPETTHNKVYDAGWPNWILVPTPG